VMIETANSKISDGDGHHLGAGPGRPQALLGRPLDEVADRRQYRKREICASTANAWICENTGSTGIFRGLRVGTDMGSSDALRRVNEDAAGTTAALIIDQNIRKGHKGQARQVV